MDSRNGLGFEKPEFGFGFPQNVVASSSYSQFWDSRAKEKRIALGRRVVNSSDSSTEPVAVPFRDVTIPVAYGSIEALQASMKRKNSWAIIVVKGYENPFLETDETKKALLDHLSPCGRIRRFDFADDPFNLLTERCALIEVWGKKGVAKAVELSGSVMEGGQKIVVRPALTFKEMAAANKPFCFQSFGSTATTSI